MSAKILNMLKEPNCCQTFCSVKELKELYIKVSVSYTKLYQARVKTSDSQAAFKNLQNQAC